MQATIAAQQQELGQKQAAIAAQQRQQREARKAEEERFKGEERQQRQQLEAAHARAVEEAVSAAKVELGAGAQIAKQIAMGDKVC